MELAAWPGGQLPKPEGPGRHDAAITPGGAIVSVVRSDEPWPPADYHEVHLKLTAVNLADDAEIVRFVQEFGPLGGTLSGNPGHLGFDWHAGYWRHVRGWLEEAGSEVTREIADWDRQAGSRRHFELLQTVREFLWQAWCIRDLVRAWRWYRDGVSVQPDEWESPVWTEHDERMLLPRDRAGAAELLRQGIRSGLRPFHPELRIASSAEDERWTTFYGGSITYYFICCLELYNHVAEHASLRTCANEHCGRLFVRQEGRAQHGQHRRTGTKYCSLNCARAQAQREFRRRRSG